MKETFIYIGERCDTHHICMSYLLHCYAVETQVQVKSLISISNKPDQGSEKQLNDQLMIINTFNTTNPLSNSDTIIFCPFLVELSLKSTKDKGDFNCWIFVVSYSSSLTCQKGCLLTLQQVKSKYS